MAYFIIVAGRIFFCPLLLDSFPADLRAIFTPKPSNVYPSRKISVKICEVVRFYRDLANLLFLSMNIFF